MHLCIFVSDYIVLHLQFNPTTTTLTTTPPIHSRNARDFEGKKHNARALHECIIAKYGFTCIFLFVGIILRVYI
jgi:hypothetical protein